MREITIVFNGDGDRDGYREGRAADAIQKYIFKALSRERMSVLQFRNRDRTAGAGTVPGSGEGEGRELEIPAFLKMYSVNRRDGMR